MCPCWYPSFDTEKQLYLSSASSTPCHFTTHHLCLLFLGPQQRLHNMLEQIKYWPEAVLCCRTLYSHPGGVMAVKNTLFAVKHGFAYALCCAPRHTWCSYIKHWPCRWLYWEGKQRVEPVRIISFLRTIFQHSTKSFPFGVLGWPWRRDWAIKLMNGRLMDFIPLLKKKARDVHKVSFFLMLQEFEEFTFDRWRSLHTYVNVQLNIAAFLS